MSKMHIWDDKSEDTRAVRCGLAFDYVDAFSAGLYIAYPENDETDYWCTKCVAKVSPLEILRGTKL